MDHPEECEELDAYIVAADEDARYIRDLEAELEAKDKKLERCLATLRLLDSAVALAKH